MKSAEGKIKRRILTPDDGAAYFFGYYDLQAYSGDDRYHLLHRVTVDYQERLPDKNDVAELGYIDLKTGEITYFAETTAWNFQQGALLQWNPASPCDEVIYNVRDGENFHTLTHNLKTGEKKMTDRACANISPDGKWGLAVNMSRIYDFRPGYGYSDVPDKLGDIPNPENDGIYLVNMETGNSKLIIDYKRIQEEFPHAELGERKHVVNHITFNTASDRFLFLNRNFLKPGDPRWFTSLITSDLDGNMYCLLNHSMTSHYHWKNDKQILGWLCHEGENAFWLLNDETHNGSKIEHPLLNRDLHMIYSPDRRFFVGDGYPVDDYRNIYLYEVETGEAEMIFADKSLPYKIGDNRVDLHNRWNRKGDRISFDSCHREKREICELDVSYLYE